ncbi:DUF3662 domain-containing protein [Kocuria sp. JC486]|uniref:FhaA domain-containing protein n=1 Tax=Kocuria sp. JC486 TaxID=1970736 RepID=UPI001423EFC7|nr:DUF3662 and FHA domain-containing protein [Kocuria sp. JC486]NHU86064.1 DUF3662 domain-containing protein [Kocuria sp. JC486]
MGFLDNLERGIERVVRTAFSTGSRKRIEAVEIASALRRELDEQSFTISAGRTMAPNVFVVEFSDEDFPRAQEWGTPLAEELCEVVIRHARSQTYTLQGAVRVSFTRNPDVERGEFVISSSAQRTEEPTAAAHRADERRTPRPRSAPAYNGAPSAHGGSHRSDFGGGDPYREDWSHPTTTPQHWVPVLEIDGHRLALDAESVVLGRSAEADVTIEDTGVSRRHLEIRHEGDHWLAVDLGSTNGSHVDGERVRGRAELVNGSVISMGRSRIVFRLVAPRRNH